MLNLTANALKVLLALEPCDMRKSFNRLQQVAADHFQGAPQHGTPFSSLPTGAATA